MKPIFISIKHFCMLYGIGRTKAYDLISRGDITVAKIGSRTFITSQSADDFARRSVQQGES